MDRVDVMIKKLKPVSHSWQPEVSMSGSSSSKFSPGKSLRHGSSGSLHGISGRPIKRAIRRRNKPNLDQGLVLQENKVDRSSLFQKYAEETLKDFWRVRTSTTGIYMCVRS